MNLSRSYGLGQRPADAVKTCCGDLVRPGKSKAEMPATPLIHPRMAATPHIPGRIPNVRVRQPSRYTRSRLLQLPLRSRRAQAVLSSSDIDPNCIRNIGSGVVFQASESSLCDRILTGPRGGVSWLKPKRNLGRNPHRQAVRTSSKPTITATTAARRLPECLAQVHLHHE